MPERLVDVNVEGRVAHTFPVTVSEQTAKPTEEAFKGKALEAAANAKVVQNQQLDRLSANMHVSRGGPLEPYGDPLGVLAETKPGLEQVVRERAYLLWEQAGRPEGRADDFWYQARHHQLRERAYSLWEREGCPAGKADEHWYRMLEFEKE